LPTGIGMRGCKIPHGEWLWLLPQFVVCPLFNAARHGSQSADVATRAIRMPAPRFGRAPACLNPPTPLLLDQFQHRCAIGPGLAFLLRPPLQVPVFPLTLDALQVAHGATGFLQGGRIAERPGTLPVLPKRPEKSRGASATIAST